MKFAKKMVRGEVVGGRGGRWDERRSQWENMTWLPRGTLNPHLKL